MMQPIPEDPSSELSPELVAALSALGAVEAPHELWIRTQLTLLGQSEAPEELRARVEAEVRLLARPRPILVLRRFAAAAAVLLFGGLTLVLDSQPLDPGRLNRSGWAAVQHASLREHYASGVVLLEVEPGRLSPAARSVAGLVGTLITDGSENLR